MSKFKQLVKTIKIHRIFLVLIFLSALLLRYRGIQWPLDLHLDERKIGEWLEFAFKNWALDRVYPGGFFTLAIPFFWLYELWVWGVESWNAWLGGEVVLVVYELDGVMFARMLNVWLGAVTCVFAYLLAKRVSGTVYGGLFAAWLVAFNQAHVEHSHYAETDIAMVLMLFIAFWLWACLTDLLRKFKAGRTDGKTSPSVFWKCVFLFLLCCFISGFAAGTKYYLALLILLVPVFAGNAGFLGARGLWRRAAAVTAFNLSGLLVFIGGFLTATPAALKFSWFVNEMKHGAAAVYQETQGILGPAFGEPAALYAANINQLKQFAVLLGMPLLLLALLGLIMLCAGRRRKYWPVMLLFPVVYLYYFIFKSPWVREQECMNLLPVLCVAASIPIASALNFRFRRVRPAFLLPVSVLAVFALVFTFLHGVRVSSVFGWTDNRFLAEKWMIRHAPESAKYGAEIYTQPASRVFQYHRIYKVERDGIEHAVAHDCNYIFRNTDMMGRGLFDPRTGSRFPVFQDKFDMFLHSSMLLKEWALLPSSAVHPMFIGNGIQLYSVGRESGTNVFDGPLARPLFVSQDKMVTYFPVGARLAAPVGKLVGRTPETVAVGGPESPDGPVYLVFNTRERPATVKLAGFGRRRIVNLDADAIAVVELTRNCFVPRFSEVEKIVVSAEFPGSDSYFPCLMRVTFDPAEAALFCSMLGHDSKAFDLLVKSGADISFPADAFLYAARAGRITEAAHYVEDAREVVRCLDEAAGNEFQGVEYAGVSAAVYDEFARIRVQAPGDTGRVRAFPIHPSQEPTHPYHAFIVPDITIAEGVYSIEFDLSVELLLRYTAHGKEKMRITDFDGNVLDSGYVSEFLEWRRVSGVLKAGREVMPLIRIDSDAPLLADYKNLELKWSLGGQLTSRKQALDSALADYGAAVIGFVEGDK